MNNVISLLDGVHRTMESVVEAFKEAVGIGAANLVYGHIGFTILSGFAPGDVFVVD